jgi:hypothetical protein
MATLRSLLCLVIISTAAQAADKPFGIHIVDEASGRGIPLIELRTVNDIRLVTDSAGWAAFNEPGLMGREVYFAVSGPGYELAKDGFGYTGIRPTPREGETFTAKLKRTNIAERIARTTGQGIYRDSELLGLPCPVPNLMAEVMGQDSVQATPYKGKIFWLWGDTNNPQYPLGNYQTTSATTPLAMRPEQGLRYDYFMSAAAPTRLRHMYPHREPGCVWLFGLLTIPDAQGGEALLAHYGRFMGLDQSKDHGICRFTESSGVFEQVVELEKSNTWRHLRGNAVRVITATDDYFYFAEPFLHTRVKATLPDLLNPASYQALHFDEAAQQYRWQSEAPPTTQGEEQQLLRSGKMKAETARYALTDTASSKPVRLHGASIEWNAHRRCYVLIGLQSGDKTDPSPLGEVWYAEAKTPDGPWLKAVKVASHPRYSYYNPVHHAFFDADGGRTIYFQGTYSLEFSGNPLAPARYDYNQLMYRLDLDDERLRTLRE